MKVLCISKILILVMIYILNIATTLCFAQDNNNALLSEERRILQQLNILKRNNIVQDTDKQDVNENEDTIKEEPTVANTPTNTNTFTKEPTSTPTPTFTPTLISTTKPDIKLEKQNTDVIEKDIIDSVNNSIKNDSNVFPQKDIQVVMKPSSNDNITSNCFRENKQLEIANQKILELSRELENKKKQLILVETEVERLSEVIEKRNRAELGQGGSTPNPNISPKIVTPQRQVINIRKPLSDLESEKADMPIVVVNVNKANLRAGPSLKDSPILEVSKGTRLVVETRQGSWYRVMAPNGKRAWVSSDVVNFGPTSNSRPSYTTRIKGYNPDVENRMESIYK